MIRELCELLFSVGFAFGPLHVFLTTILSMDRCDFGQM